MADEKDKPPDENSQPVRSPVPPPTTGSSGQSRTGDKITIIVAGDKKN